MRHPLERIVRPDLVPGVVRCAKCAFQLHRTNLHMSNGTTSAGNSDTEPCPNGCGPLWPVTWKQWAEEASATAERFFDEAKAEKNKVDDLAALVRRLAHSLDKPNGNTLLARQAVDYLRRHGLEGSPLRDQGPKLPLACGPQGFLEMAQ